jgi:hypothetical protein
MTMKKSELDNLENEFNSLKEAARFIAYVAEVEKLKKQEKANEQIAETFYTHLERCRICEKGRPRLFNINYTGSCATAHYYCPKCGGQYEERKLRKLEIDVEV